jgi:tropomyosin-2
MEAIKKKIAALKMEMDAANEKVEANEVKAKQENMRADKIYDEVRDLEKKLVQMEKDYTDSKSNLETSTAELERCEKAYTKVSKRQLAKPHPETHHWRVAHCRRSRTAPR